jgi:hypothetical protein
VNKDENEYYENLKRKFKNKKKSLFRYVSIDLNRLGKLDKLSDNELIKKLESQKQFGLHSLLHGYIYHNKPRFFNDPFDCVFGVGLETTFRELVYSLVDRKELKKCENVINDIPEGESIEDLEDYVKNIELSNNLKQFLLGIFRISKKTNEQGYDFLSNHNLSEQKFLEYFLDDTDLVYYFLCVNHKKNLSKKDLNIFIRNARKRYNISTNSYIDVFDPNIDDFKSLSRKYEDVDFDAIEQKLNDTVNEINRKIFDLIDTRFGVASLTTLGNDALMWSHYAGSHRGFVVEYDISEYLNGKSKSRMLLMPVNYTSKRVCIDENVMDEIDLVNYDLKGNEDIVKMFLKGIYTKYTKWSIEKEWRSLTVLPENNEKMRKVKTLSIKSVYFGNKMDSRIVMSIRKLLDKYNLLDQISLYYMRNEIESFKLSPISIGLEQDIGLARTI